MFTFCIYNSIELKHNVTLNIKITSQLQYTAFVTELQIYIYIYIRVECKYSRVPCKSYTATTDGTDAVTHVLIYGSRQSR